MVALRMRTLSPLGPRSAWCPPGHTVRPPPVSCQITSVSRGAKVPNWGSAQGELPADDAGAGPPLLVVQRLGALQRLGQPPSEGDLRLLDVRRGAVRREVPDRHQQTQRAEGADVAAAVAEPALPGGVQPGD